MNWLTGLFSGSANTLITTVGNVADKFITTQEDKLSFLLELEKLLQQRDTEIEQTLRAEMEAKAQIIVAEMQQGDTYTKRARPTVVYFGLVAIALAYILVPGIQALTGTPLTPLELPSDFWWAWGGIVSTWTIGRSMEKGGAANRGTAVVTGSQNSALIKKFID